MSSFIATYMKLVPLLAESPLIYQTLSADHYVSHEHTIGKGRVESDSVQVEKWDKPQRSAMKAKQVSSSPLLFFLVRVKLLVFFFRV